MLIEMEQNTPSNTLLKNRTRLDFFIVSTAIVDQIKKCQIEPAKQNKLFDHKAVTISFKPPPKVIRPPTISREILHDPELELVVRLCVADTYIIHSDTLQADEKTRLSNQIGNAKKLTGKLGYKSPSFYRGKEPSLK